AHRKHLSPSRQHCSIARSAKTYSSFPPDCGSAIALASSANDAPLSRSSLIYLVRLFPSLKFSKPRVFPYVTAEVYLRLLIVALMGRKERDMRIRMFVLLLLLTTVRIAWSQEVAPASEERQAQAESSASDVPATPEMSQA